MPRAPRPRAALVAVAVTLFAAGFLYGVMYGADALSVLATTPPFGILSDRVGRRPPLLWGFAVQALATLLFALRWLRRGGAGAAATGAS
ncbi:MAG TPA: hypothetical protein VFL90_00725 [Methylomirabilota bacterium]|nr:hypothetical protein [Methylomirabilota bacterium]